MSLDLTLKNSEIKFRVGDPLENRVFEFDDFRLDVSTRLLFQDGEQVILTPKAVETLIALVESAGKVVSKDELMQKIWADTIVEESNLAQYLHVLRKTLGKTDDGKPYTETLKRRGYRFNGSVRIARGGNGLPSSVADAGDKAATETSQSRPAPHRIESRGNVRAFGNLAAARQIPHPVERADNIYSVSDWPREHAADALLPVVPTSRPKWLIPLLIAVLVAGSIGSVFGVFKFVTGRPGTEVRNVPFLGSGMTRLTTTGRSKHVALSPDGKYFAQIIEGNDGDSLSVRQIAVANDMRVAGPSKSEFVWVTFAPDGNFLYYLTLERDKGSTELFRVPVMGGPVTKVAHDVGAPTLSPDGTKLAYVVQNKNETRLIVADNDGRESSTSRQAPDYLYANESVLASRHEPDYMVMYWYAPAWSPDGKSIAFAVNQSDENGRYETVVAVDVESRVERRLTGERWQQVGQPRWLPDGLVVTASDTSTGPDQLWHISLVDGAASRLTRDLNSYRHLSLSSNGENLAVIQNHSVSKIWTAQEDMSDPRQILSEAGRFNEIIWLPDGRIAFTSNSGGTSDIWTMNADGSGVRQLTVGANARLGLAVTADEKQLIFAAERDGKYNLWRVDIDGRNLTRITDGNGEYYPQCTPDGRWIVYQSGGNYPTLRKMPVGGGESTTITETTASRPSISPDGKFVAYHYLDSSFEGSRWGIGIISLDDGKRVKRFDFPPTVVERLVKWTRDGKSIAFLNSPGGVPNIWLQPVDGGAPTALTNFPSDNIIAFNWNPDGSKLAVIRGVETSDVVLISRSSSK